MKMKRLISIFCILVFLSTMIAGCGGGGSTANNATTAPKETAAAETQKETAASTASSGELPRNETLYLNGLAWGAPTNFNPLTTNAVFLAQYDNNTLLIYETLFMYNQLTGGIEPLLGKSYTWADDYTLKVELNQGTRFNDGKPLTAEDVAYSFMLGKKYSIKWSSIMDYIEDVQAESPTVAAIKLSKEKYNRLEALLALSHIFILPKHIWEPIETKANNKIEEIRKEFNPNPVGSGPYKLKFYDDTRYTLERDDNYWGKSLFGKLPAPKYIGHMIYKSNDAGSNAFRNGEVDVSQQFIPKAWDLWKDGAPYKTYMDKTPYHIPGQTPQIFFNMTKKGLDNVNVRKAIAMCIDYKKIGEVAMSGYTDEIEPGIVLKTDAEQKLINKDELQSLYWKTDVDAANTLLDSIGAKKGADGIRVLNGTRLGPWELECPYGWSDWNASLEIVAQSAKKIGIELRTKFPEMPVWINDRATGKFDILMDGSLTMNPAQPWDRARYAMDSSLTPAIGESAFNNWGRFKNARADELIKLIPQQKDENGIKKMYTELNKIYIENIPTIQLMYRPSSFYTVQEKVWKGFPDAENNPKNIPPTPFSGAFVKVLYEISADK